jgi:mono/diheme cytochrome c family protein
MQRFPVRAGEEKRESRNRLAILAPLLVATSSLIEPGAALAADPADGLRLARHWCSSCHLVEPGVKTSDAAPPFPAVGRDPTSTPEKLHAWLANPHPPMPNLTLSRQQEDDIIAYILSFKPQ